MTQSCLLSTRLTVTAKRAGEVKKILVCSDFLIFVGFEDLFDLTFQFSSSSGSDLVVRNKYCYFWSPWQIWTTKTHRHAHTTNQRPQQTMTTINLYPQMFSKIDYHDSRCGRSIHTQQAMTDGWWHAPTTTMSMDDYDDRWRSIDNAYHAVFFQHFVGINAKIQLFLRTVESTFEWSSHLAALMRFLACHLR